MDKLLRIKLMGIGCVAGAVILELIGALAGIKFFMFVAFVLLLGFVIIYIVSYRCPHCGKFLGGGNSKALVKKDGKYTCMFCGNELE